MDRAAEAIETVPGDGGDGPVDAEVLRALKAAAHDWNARAELYWTARIRAERTRLCRWPGQSPDGRLRREFQEDNALPEPFDGASDQRVRWADGLIGEQVRMLTVALARAQVRCQPSGAGDEKAAAAAETMLRWMIESLRGEWLRQHQVALNYMVGDTPAVAAMHIDWAREERLELVQMDAAQLREMYLTAAAAQRVRLDGQPQDPELEALAAQADADTFDGVVMAPDGDLTAAADLLVQWFPGTRPARARRAAGELRRTGRAEWPVRVMTFEGPKLRAMRFGDDFVLPDNAADFQRASPWFAMEWMTAAELRAKIASDDWDSEWVEAVLTKEGQAALTEYQIGGDGHLVRAGSDRHKGRYQVLWCYFTAVNEDDVLARYVCVMRPDVEGTAFGRRMLRQKHGLWPAVWYQREVLDAYCLDSRGVSELEGPRQGIAKLLQDTETDAAHIGGLPPVITTDSSHLGNVYLEPLKHIPLRRDGTLKFMQPPAFPATIESMLKRLRMDRDEYWGRESPDANNARAAAVAAEFAVLTFMDVVREELRMLLALAQQNASDEWLAKVTDRGRPAPMTAADIQGSFDVSVQFDAAELDTQRTIDRAKAVQAVLLGADRDKTINTTPWVQHVFRSLYPGLAADSLRTVQQSSDTEVEDERRNYASIRAGVLPALDTEGGWNYALRLQFYEQLVQANPAVFDDMAADKLDLLRKWMAALEQQRKQYGENVATGRAGVDFGAEPGGAAPADETPPQEGMP